MVNCTYTYLQLKKIRDEKIVDLARNHVALNQFHDYLIQQVVKEAIRQMDKEWGRPPSSFSFFMMGSGGRFEQATWSDQDHGIVFQDNSKHASEYFLKLGHEISEGLSIAGYERCEGGVMASNPLWCKSLHDWQQQLAGWIDKATWESIRHLLIFIDARSLHGCSALTHQLKQFVYRSVHNKNLFFRMFENTMHINKGIGVLGQLLVESHGLFQGELNLKETAFFPYVNSIRLLAIKDNVFKTSTITRLHHLSTHVLSSNDQKYYIDQYNKLLDYRKLYGRREDYNAVHYLPIDHLSKDQRKEIKTIIKTGLQLYHHTRKIMELRCSKCE